VAGLQHGINYVTKAITGSNPVFEKLAGLDHSNNVVEATGYQNVIDKMRETLLFTSLGIDISEYLKLLKITGHPLWSIGNEEPTNYNGGQESVNATESEYVISYCTDAVLLIEEKVGDIENPFGNENPF